MIGWAESLYFRGHTHELLGQFRFESLWVDWLMKLQLSICEIVAFGCMLSDNYCNGDSEFKP